MPGLRDIPLRKLLDAATRLDRDMRTEDEHQARVDRAWARYELDMLSPELAAWNLEATERLRNVRAFYGHLMGEHELADHDALLARLDQLGVREDGQLGKEPNGG